MPLTAPQQTIARLISGNRSPASHLAGGAGIHIGPDSPRYTNDLDYFHDEETLVAQSFQADRAVLLAAGYRINLLLSQPGFVRALVGKDGAATKVEWAHDSAWRFLPPVENADVGWQLHPVDLSINKILALAGRDEPRDFLDTIYVHRQHLSLGALCWAAVGKDPGYNPAMLVEMLARKGRYQPEDFSNLRLETSPDLPALKQIWLRAIDDARALVRRLPPEDAGCLYLDPVSGKFVTPAENLSALVRHRGKPGGILPHVGVDEMLSANPAARRALTRHYGGNREDG
ncbi:hypothetical protein OPIT5_16195 [Opitutaceae bacterium TAV5]|nr:hypothetical protein OPIT5_16195 [Opitutaceae bacterium TAV5]